MSKHGVTSAIALFFLSISLFSVTAAAQTGWPRTVAGATGNITLTQAPMRIVSTSVTLTGSLLAIDAPVVASGATAPGSRLADKQGFFRQWGEVAKQRGVKRLYIGEPSAEAIAAEAPDLIVVSATGNDSAIKLVEQLAAIAPVLVVNYDDKSWQQLVTLLGEATGHEAEAAARKAEFDAREKALKAKLTLPPQPVSAMVWNGDGRAVNLWTDASAQGNYCSNWASPWRRRRPLFRLVTAWDSVKISCNCQEKIWRQALMVNHICCLPPKSPPPHR